MIYRAQADHGQLKTRLAKTRQMMSLIEKDIIAGSSHIVRHTENWVPMWIDEGHQIGSDCGTMNAVRGIGFDGTLMWLVRHDSKTYGYHSQATCPFEAFEDARDAWSRRAQVRAEWSDVERITRELLTGRLRFRVTRADAYASPLCRAGIDGFMASIGMPNVQSISGRTAALLMRIDPQIGFVIREAHRRHVRDVRAVAQVGLKSGAAEPTA